MATITRLTTAETESMVRNDVIAQLKRNLRARSATRWSVTGGRGTAYGWLTIRKMVGSAECGFMDESERRELAALLGLTHVGWQGWKVAASHEHYREALDRTAGRQVRAIAQPYWD